MRDHELYAQILGVSSPWRVSDVSLRTAEGMIVVRIVYEPAAVKCCPMCSGECPGYDTREKSWRHLDTCQLRTILTADVPRVQCPEHGVHQIAVPWAEPNSGFTALFECLVIDWLQEASIKAASELLRLTWHEVDGIRSRAVKRGLARRKPADLKHIGVDETSFQKRHDYVTIVVDQDIGNVVFVGDDRKEATLYDFYGSLPIEQLEEIKTIAMDMWGPFIAATRKAIPDADRKIAFDRFHVAKHLGDAVDKVRRAEHRDLSSGGDNRLKGSRYAWLQRPENMTDALRIKLELLKTCSLKTARAWAIKDYASCLWDYRSRYGARRAWDRWLSWAIRSRLEPIKRVARMVKTHIEGIVTAVVEKVTTARSEGINSQVQWIKRQACGFRNRDRFREAIYFHLGGLNLYPRLQPAQAPTHTKP